MVDVNAIAPDALSNEEVKNEPNHLYRILIYGNPGTAKTHFAYTMPAPVVMIDTEGKADRITQKFDKDIHLFQVDDYVEARDALHQALDLLDAYKDEENQIGTLVVDSFSEIWDWAQQRHVEMKYPGGKGVDDVNLKSALNSDGGGDWQHIKRLHNERFREPMLMCDYHICWTCKSEEDYGAILSGEADEPPAKPSGEKNNLYKATEMIHTYEGPEGRPHANLKKSALTKWRFGEMEWPTFPKAREVIETVADAEASEQQYTLGQIMNQFEPNVQLYEGDPDMVVSGD